ncbi:MAG: undecaprenyl diphosphate synthase family protein [Bacillota bacterium]|nr:undecaprenyl diphosphate synthase family protein [Bacillota bacterium]
MWIPKHIGVIHNDDIVSGNYPNNKNCIKLGRKSYLNLFKVCKELGVEELTYYCYSIDAAKAYNYLHGHIYKEWVDIIKTILQQGSSILVVGNTESASFPMELLSFTSRGNLTRPNGIKVNFLINYSGQWDLENEILDTKISLESYKAFRQSTRINSYEIQKIDLILDFNSENKSNDFLPVQSKESYHYKINAELFNFRPIHIFNALQQWKRQNK